MKYPSPEFRALSPTINGLSDNLSSSSLPSASFADDSDGSSEDLPQGPIPRNIDRSSARRNSNQRPPADKLRKTLLSRIIDDLNTKVDPESLGSKYEANAKECLRDESKSNSTILHWILETNRNIEVPGRNLKALEELIKLSLKLDPDLLMEKDRRDETALHLALSTQHDDFESLAECMCKSVPDTTIRKALGARNNKGETPIHLAVMEGLGIASYLVERSDEDTLLLQRHAESTGSPLSGGKNTALHDAVAYKRCKAEECGCGEKESARCDELNDKMWAERSRVLELIEGLIHRCPAALTSMNSADESPYLYHLSTKKVGKRDAHARSLKETTNSASRTSKSGTTRKDEAIAMSGNSRPPPAGDLKSSSKVETTKFGTHGYDGIEKPRADQTVEIPASQKVDRERTRAPPKLEKCSKPVQSEKIESEVESYLLESAFTLGNFKEACECFFGRDRGKCLPREHI